MMPWAPLSSSFPTIAASRTGTRAAATAGPAWMACSNTGAAPTANQPARTATAAPPNPRAGDGTAGRSHRWSGLDGLQQHVRSAHVEHAVLHVDGDAVIAGVREHLREVGAVHRQPATHPRPA